VTERVSFTGSVLAMAAMAVKPPAAAARVPVAIVSLYSWPGSRRWTCMSIRPGATTRPAASIVGTGAPPGGEGSGPARRLVAPGVLPEGRDVVAGHPLVLEAEHHDDVDVADGILQPPRHLGAQLLDPGRDEGGRPRDRHRHPHRPHGRDVGARHAAVGDVPDDGHREPVQVSPLLPDGEAVEAGLA